ncbi:hypothetical protein I5E68_13640 [Novosphingobium sp. YJ-S2-02]|uniref:Uncharacterized protein n=1 Tax=Novosphingobium aureum TaxID=2792964 RepID=A0A931HDB0_9SPHN|nr:hypothetical protein [Novosphingobium aureum]MBH0113985.1 hypothetical protein [Novosphingobium aureum]
MPPLSRNFLNTWLAQACIAASEIVRRRKINRNSLLVGTLDRGEKVSATAPQERYIGEMAPDFLVSRLVAG